MILTKLTFRNAYGEDGTVTFSARADGVSETETSLGETVFRALTTAMFGADERDFSELSDDAEITLEFREGDETYLLTRSYREGGEMTELICRKGEESMTLNPNKRKSVLDAAFGRRSAKFTGTPEYFVAALRGNAPSVAEINDKRTETREEIARAEEAKRAAELLANRIGIPKSPKIDFDAIAAERDSVLSELRRFEEKERVMKEAEDAKRELEEFIRKNGDTVRLTEILERDDRLREARALNEKHDTANREAETLRKSLAELGAKSDAVRKKSAGGDGAEKECEADFIIKSERVNALRKKFMDEMCASDDENSEIRRSLDEYYAANDPQIQDLKQKKKRLDNEYEALLLSITSLENKKNGLVHPMSYKKAVIDGTVLEYKIEKLTSTIEDGNRRSGELQLETSAKEEDIRDAETECKRKTAEKAELMQTLLQGKYKTLEEAVNADQALKNETYAAFVTAENLTAEIAALNEKIAGVKRQNDENAEKQKELQKAKTEIEVRLLKLNRKKETFENEYRNKCAENLFAEEAGKLRFGDRCPVCDGYIVKKNEIPHTATEAVGENIRKVQYEINDNEKRLDRILLKLGAYLSTTASGDAFIVSLENTLKKKEGLLKRIYRDFGAENKEAFGHAIEKIGAESAKFNEGIRTLNVLSGGIAEESEKKNVLENAVRQLSSRETKRIRAIVTAAQAELEIALQEYQKLMPVFGGRPAKELLSGSLIDDIELETVDGDLVSQTKNFREVTVQKIETDRILILLKNKLISDLKDTESESAMDVALRETSRKAKEMARELEDAESALEEAKLKLAAVRRVNRNSEKEIGAAEADSETVRARILLAEQTAADAAERSEKILESLGVPKSDLNSAILGNADRNKAEKAIREFEEKKQRLTYRADFTAARPVTLEFIDVEALKARGKTLDKLAADGAVEVAKYEYLTQTAAELERECDALNRTIAKANRKKEALTVWSEAVKDGAVDFELLSVGAAKKASETLSELSGGKCRFTVSERGEISVNGEEAGNNDAIKLSAELAVALLKSPFGKNGSTLIARWNQSENEWISRIPLVAENLSVAVISEKTNESNKIGG